MEACPLHRVRLLCSREGARASNQLFGSVDPGSRAHKGNCAHLPVLLSAPRRPFYSFYSLGQSPAGGNNCARTMHNKRPRADGDAGPHAVSCCMMTTERCVVKVGQRGLNVQAADEATVDRRCENPDCSVRIAWSGRPGRPQLFCTPACRKRAVASAARLEKQIAELEVQVQSAGLTYREGRSAAADLARLRWLLSAYPASARLRGE